MTTNLDSPQSKPVQKPTTQTAVPAKNTTQPARVNAATSPQVKALPTPAVKTAGNPNSDTAPVSKEAATASKSSVLGGMAAAAPAAKNAGSGDAKAPVNSAAAPNPTVNTPAAKPSGDKPAEPAAALPGEYGRQAALTAQKDPKVFDKGLSITDPKDPRKADLFAYAETDLAQADSNQDRVVSLAEVKAFFAKNNPNNPHVDLISRNFFRAVNADQNNGIDPVENAGLVMYQMANSLDSPIDPKNPMAPPNKVTTFGVDIANTMILTSPETVRQTLEEAIVSNKFVEEYQTYLAQVEAAKPKK